MIKTAGLSAHVLAALVVGAAAINVPGRAISEPFSLPAATWSKPIDANAIADCVKKGDCKLSPGPQSRFEYAQRCTQAIAPIPAFDCISGVEIPITVTKKVLKELPIGLGGKIYVEQTVTEKPTQPVDTCDKPVKLALGSQGQCVPYSRLKDLSPADKPKITTLAICRKYYASTGPADPNFDDIAIIQHNSITGATCYFQSRVIHDPTVGRHDGTKVPSPMSSDTVANAFWLEPEKDSSGKVVALNPKTPTASGPINCVSCHDSDPFILSPWIGQVADVTKWDPQHKFRVDMFGTFSKFRPWVVDAAAFNPDGVCASCHRFGGSSIKKIAAGGGGQTVDGLINFHGFMPPWDKQSPASWQQQYGVELKKILACIGVQPPNVPAADCKAWLAGTK